MKLITGCLLSVILSLLVVGVVSATLLRHIVQITPVALALIATTRRASWSPYAALPLFVFWLVIMAFIWLFLLGVATIVSGRFTPIEIAMTIIVGICSLVGARASPRITSGTKISVKVLTFLLFLALQVFAMWLSLRESIAHA
ncbi:MAG: hypothetical protein HY033_06730 [Ignavibacteriae bacterium]|nr:hypothetical protein [Ignavibacteria bacterium]MBI3364587.1 hypothetical protein [Ignavibacteriota bacterium]